ncbi:MAG: DUF5103 domain-containing protein [Bacteroidetes bacterium]|nr:DUF5103 domain-containing protein [Bacteroidota bacterium]
MLSAQDLVYDDHNYLPEIQSVQFYRGDDPLSDPVLRTDEAGSLTLAFDMLGDMAYIFDYTIIHCNRDWTPSALRPQEYIEGFTDDRITDYAFSLNTLTPYVHYKLSFPGSQLRPRLSGNYLLVVYRGTPSAPNLILSRRFWVIDPMIPIRASVAQNTRQAGLNRTHQMLDISISLPARFSGIPADAFSLDILQNNRRDNAVTGLKPSHVVPGRMTFEYVRETTFEGANQWRNFDMKSYRYQSERIQRIIQQHDGFLVRLWPDTRRNRQVYKSEPDLNGRRLIRARQDQNTDIEGDYAWVEFFLPWDPPLTHDEIYVTGQLNDWQLNDRNRMTYNFGLRGYELSLFLKQGYYNYLYVLRDKQTGSTSTMESEGSFWDTQNKYTMILYFRQPGTAYDQIAGYALTDAH